MRDLHGKRLFLLDMDGTIYLDDTLFDGTRAFLDYVRSSGGAYLFLTNNSSRSVTKYIEKLAHLGIASETSDFLTSIDAMIAYLRANGGAKKYYVLGTESFKSQLRSAGFPIADRLEDDIDCLLCGFDTELTFQKLEDACILLNRGVSYFATNPDWVCPTWYGYVPDCGSVCKMLETATGRAPRFLGKPQPDIVRLAMARCGCTADETLVIGDRLYTDIACGIHAGVDTALVLSGESTMQDVAVSEFKPTYIFESIRNIYEILAFGGKEE